MKNPPDYPNTLPGVVVVGISGSAEWVTLAAAFVRSNEDWLYKRYPEACFRESSGIPMVFLLTLTRQVISVTEGVRNQRFVDWMRQQIRVPETLSYMWVMWVFLKRLPFSTMSIHFLQLWYWLQQASSTAQLAEGPWPIRWAFEQGPDCPGRDWLEVLWAVDIFGLEMGWVCLKMGDTIFEWGKWSWTTGALFSGTHTYWLFDVVWCCLLLEWISGFLKTTGRFPASNMDVQKKLVGCSDADEIGWTWYTLIHHHYLNSSVEFLVARSW